MSDKQSSLDPQFDSYAENYDVALNQGLAVTGETKEFYAVGRLKWLHNRLRQERVKVERALDYGCGTGTSGPLLQSFCGVREVLGVEVSSKSIAVARLLHPEAGLSFGLMADCKPCDEFDLAFCNGVFHHIPQPDRMPSVEYVFRSLKPGGMFALFENNPWNPGTQFVMSRIPFDRDAIKICCRDAQAMLRAAGFEIVTTDFIFFFPRILAWLRRFESRLCKFPLGAQYLVLARKPTAVNGCTPGAAAPAQSGGRR